MLPALAVVAAFIVWQWRFFRQLPRALSAAVLLLTLLRHVQALSPTWRLSLGGHGDQLSLGPAAVAAATAPTQEAEEEHFERELAAVRA